VPPAFILRKPAGLLPMKILFIHLVPPESGKVYHGFNHGIGYLSAYLKRDGHQTHLLEIAALNEKPLSRALGEFAPHLIGLSSTSGQVPLMERLCEFLSACFDGPVFAGGVGPTVEPERVLDFAGVAGVCIGEGEEAFCKLAGKIERSEDFHLTDNFIFKRDGVTVTDDAAVLARLDELPFPDRSIFPVKSFLKRYGNLIGMEFLAGRGCPFRCAYCGNDFFNRLYGKQGGFFRVRSVGRVIDEVLRVKRTFGDFNLAGFHDDIFGLDEGWLEEFSHDYRRRVGTPFWCNQKPDIFDARRAKLLKKAGCVRVHMGVECGNGRIRKEVLGRDISDEQIVEAFRIAKTFGMKTVSFNMLGLPGETEKELLQTVRLNRKIKPDWLLYSIFHPFPGTELYEVCLRKGLVKKGSAGGDYYSPDWSIDSKLISRRRLREIYDSFPKLVYAGRNK